MFRLVRHQGHRIAWWRLVDQDRFLLSRCYYSRPAVAVDVAASPRWRMIGDGGSSRAAPTGAGEPSYRRRLFSTSTKTDVSSTESSTATGVETESSGVAGSGSRGNVLSPDADDAEIEQMIKDHAVQSQTSVSLQALMRTGQGEFLHRTFGEETRQRHAATELVLIQVAGFLRRELPIRLAHRLHDLDHVPLLREMPSILGVREMYKRSFVDLVQLPPTIQTEDQEERFAEIVENIYERHANAMVQMARGAFEFRKAMRDRNAESDYELQEGTHEFLDRFYICRIGIRVLIGQYLALRQPPVDNYIGIICSHTSPYEIVKRAIDDAAFMCTRKYGDAPEVIMSGRLDMTFPYVPTHLRESLSSAVSRRCSCNFAALNLTFCFSSCVSNMCLTINPFFK